MLSMFPQVNKGHSTAIFIYFGEMGIKHKLSK